MAEIFTPLTTSNLTNNVSVTANIDQNFATVAHLFTDVLSRNGTSPNQMVNTLDMNSNQIINLPSPGSASSPVRLQDISSGITPSPSIIAGNNVYTGNNIFEGSTTLAGPTTATGPVYFKDGYPWTDVIAWGADPTGINPSDTAIQSAINFMAVSGGIVFIPQGFYLITQTISAMPATQVMILGSGNTSTYLYTTTDITVLNVGGRSCVVENLFIQGKGGNATNSNPNSFGASQPAVISTASFMRNVSIVGGYNCLRIPVGDDSMFINVQCTQAYGNALVWSGLSGNEGAGNWFLRCKFDQGTPTGRNLNSDPTVAFAAWQPNHAYGVGDSMVLDGAFLFQATKAGTSGTATPLPAAYNVDVVDNSVTWQFCCPTAYCAFLLETNSNSNSFVMCDFTGGGFPSSMIMNNTMGTGNPPALTQIVDCTFGNAYNAALDFRAGSTCMVTNCYIGGNISRNTSSAVDLGPGWQGGLTITNSMIGLANYGVTIGGGTANVIGNNLISGCDNCGVTVNPGITDFVVTGNSFSPVPTQGANAAAVQIQTGASDYYVVANNLVHGLSISDGGSGTHKTVTGNV